MLIPGIPLPEKSQKECGLKQNQYETRSEILLIDALLCGGKYLSLPIFNSTEKNLQKHTNTKQTEGDWVYLVPA